MADKEIKVTVEMVEGPGTGGGAPSIPGMGGGGGGTPAAPGGGGGAPSSGSPQESKIIDMTAKGVEKGTSAGMLAGGVVGVLMEILKSSKIFTTFIGTIAELTGIFVDILLMPLIPLLIPFIQWLGQALAAFARFMQDPVGYLKNAAELVWNTIKGWALAAWDAIKSVGVAIWNTIESIGKSIWSGIKIAGEAIWDGIKLAGLVIWDFIQKAGENIWGFIQTAGENIWKFIKDSAMGIWNEVRDFVKDLWEDITDPISKAWNTISETVLGFWHKVVGFVESILKFIGNIPIIGAPIKKAFPSLFEEEGKGGRGASRSFEEVTKNVNVNATIQITGDIFERTNEQYRKAIREGAGNQVLASVVSNPDIFP